MNIQDMLITMDQTAEANQPSLFPFPPGLHVAFVSIAVVFFAYRFYVQRRPYQLLVASAIFISLAFWLSESKALYYGIGILQLVLLIAAIVVTAVRKPAEESGGASAAEGEYSADAADETEAGASGDDVSEESDEESGEEE